MAPLDGGAVTVPPYVANEKNPLGDDGRGASAGFASELRPRGGGGGGGGYQGGATSGGRGADLPGVWPMVPATILVLPGGPGGGGTSWAHASAAGIERQPGVNAGDGSVVIEWSAS